MQGFLCSSCGQYHEQMPLVFGAPAPVAWEALPTEEREARAALTSDQCIIDDRFFFLLGRLEIPVLGMSEPFTWLTWVSVSEANFDRASELWFVSGREAEPAYFGWVQSSFPYPVSTVNLKSRLVTRPVGERPLVFLQPSEHPLSLEQAQGISVARVQQLVEGLLHGA